MEVVIPMFALSSLYLINNQTNKKIQEPTRENFTSNLPNVDIPNRNYPQELPIYSETDETTELSTVNRFESAGVYTDRYFNPNKNNQSTAYSGTNVSSAPIQTSSEELQYYSLTGDKVDGTYFEHNNMVPFFGSKLYSQHTQPNANESVLDNYSGAGSQYIVKTEQSPMFAPHDALQWTFGTPNQSEFIKSRINPSNRMANVNPFAEKQVAPGLGLGYTSDGAAGYNSGLLARESWLPKNVDELRVDSKPKNEYNLYGLEGAPVSYVKNNATVEQMGVMEKHLPDQSFEMGQERYFTTTGVQKGETLHAMPIDRYVSRPETTTDYTGVAGSLAESGYVSGEYNESTKQQFEEYPLAPANANGRFYPTDGDYGIQSKVAYPNNRTANRQNSYYGLVSGGIGASVAPLLDILRPSRRQNVIGTLRPYQNPTTRVKESYIFNPADRASTTIRETTENSKYHPNVNSNQLGGAYKVTDQQASYTNRTETSDYYYAGGASATERSRKFPNYEAEYNQNNNNIKSSTIDGYMVQGNMSLMNGDMNVRQANRDEMLVNNREVLGDMPYQTPSVGSYGTLNNNGNSLYSNIQMDRNTSDITSMLSSNPFVVDYKKML